MAPHAPHSPTAFLSAAPLVVFALGDANTSIGVVGLVLAILALVAVLLAVIALEIAGEHRDNVAHRRDHPHL